jgi:hypothetical protein
MVQKILSSTLPLLRQMLPVLTNVPEATAWFGNVDESQVL